MGRLMLKVGHQLITIMTVAVIIVAMTISIGLVQIDESNAATMPKNPQKIGEGTSWDCVYFGTYQQYGPGAKDKIKWRVLQVNGNEALLFADRIIDVGIQYNTGEGDSITWADSSIRRWLNSSFIKTAFSTEEQNSIISKTIKNNNNPIHGTDGGVDTVDKVFLLSLEEVTNTSFGFDSHYSYSAARDAVNTPYVEYKRGRNYEKFDDYWLRSPGDYPSTVATVGAQGYIGEQGEVASRPVIGLRPALYINLSSTNWSYAGSVYKPFDEDVSSTESKLYEDSSEFLKVLGKKQKSVKKQLSPNIDWGETFNIPGVVATRFMSNYEWVDSKYYVPQGICRAGDYILVTAYHSGNINGKNEEGAKNSVLYVLDSYGERILGTFELPNKYHQGGIACDGENIWFCGNTSDSYLKDGKPYVQCMKYETLTQKLFYLDGGSAMNDEESGIISNFDLSEKIYISNKPSFLECYNGKLWVGTWIKAGNGKSGHITGYPIVSRGASAMPVLDTRNVSMISGIDSSAQGMDIDNGDLYVSSSHGGGNNALKSSFITKYPGVVSGNGTVRVNLSSVSGKRIQVPKMNEEILVTNANVLMIFESPSEKYLRENTWKAGMKTDYVLAVDKGLWR